MVTSFAVDRRLLAFFACAASATSATSAGSVLGGCAKGETEPPAGDPQDVGPEAAPSDALSDASFDAPDDVLSDVLVDAADATPDADASAPTGVSSLTALGGGFAIFPGGGYRYGPSILVEGDGSIDMWTCSPGSGGAWDVIRWRRSADGGKNWSADAVVLQPTAGSRDAFSTCDPGAIKLGGYWYVGYTSTEDSRGTNNQVYVARATAPAGPYEKWNGAGWGGAPQPIATYAGDASKYGAGEPSLVERAGQLYLFYSYVDAAGYTDLAVAPDASAADWPAHLVAKGHAITRRTNGEDSTDVKWAPSLGRFVGVTTVDRFGPNATVGVYESFDGLAFTPTPYLGARAQPGAHNVGVSGDALGHLDPASATFVSYAYQPPGKSWGDWPTFLDPVRLELRPPGSAVGGGVSSIVGQAADGTGGDWSWSGPRAFDGDLGTAWSSVSHGATALAEEWVAIDLGAARSIRGAVLVPRGGGLGFPVDYRLQVATAWGAWSDVPGEAVTGATAPTAPLDRTFASPVSARYLRLLASRLGTDDFANHYLQLVELSAKLAP